MQAFAADLQGVADANVEPEENVSPGKENDGKGACFVDGSVVKGRYTVQYTGSTGVIFTVESGPFSCVVGCGSLCPELGVCSNCSSAKPFEYSCDFIARLS